MMKHDNGRQTDSHTRTPRIDADKVLSAADNINLKCSFKYFTPVRGITLH